MDISKVVTQRFTWRGPPIYAPYVNEAKRRGLTCGVISENIAENKDNKKHDQGTYTYPNGDKYVGDWKGDKKHGQGTYTYANGSKEVGAFENNKKNGYAITYYANGNINQEGIFKDDKFLYTQKKSNEDELKVICEEIGFTPKTVDFGNCVLKLMK